MSKSPFAKTINIYPVQRTNMMVPNQILGYAKIRRSVKINAEQFVKLIEDNSLVGSASLAGCTTAIVNAVTNFLCNGHSVSFGDLFIIRPVVKAWVSTFYAEGHRPAPDEEGAWLRWCYYFYSSKGVKSVAIATTWNKSIKELESKYNYNFVVVGRPVVEDEE